MSEWEAPFVASDVDLAVQRKERKGGCHER
jgi:hypothetical protein